jgi:multicomponent Na+:H+ antiporter subunit D
VAGHSDFVVGGIFPSGTSNFTTSILLLLFVFGIGKAALMPMHFWLPNAMVAPTPVSALLHAVAVVKAWCFFSFKDYYIYFWRGCNGGYEYEYVLILGGSYNDCVSFNCCLEKR